jgi:anthranilate phosphoribosyltransferase
VGLAVRGETEDEIVGFARTMRARAVPHAKGAVDTCGTGGGGAGTFNISTVASLVVAAASPWPARTARPAELRRADVLEALEVKIDARSRSSSAAWTSGGRSCSRPASTPRPATR